MSLLGCFYRDSTCVISERAAYGLWFRLANVQVARDVSNSGCHSSIPTLINVGEFCAADMMRDVKQSGTKWYISTVVAFALWSSTCKFACLSSLQDYEFILRTRSVHFDISSIWQRLGFIKGNCKCLWLLNICNLFILLLRWKYKINSLLGILSTGPWEINSDSYLALEPASLNMVSTLSWHLQPKDVYSSIV